MEYDTGVKMSRATGFNMNESNKKKKTLRQYKRQLQKNYHLTPLRQKMSSM